MTSKRAVPFASALTIGFLLSAPVAVTRAQLVEYAASVALAVLAAGAALAHRRLFGPALGPLCILSIALLRESTGGARGALGVLMLLPVVWTALYGTRRRLHVVLATFALAWIVPLLAVGAPEYPLTGWRTLALSLLTAGIAGATIQRLVRTVSAQAAEREALLARFDLMAHTDVLTGLPNRRAWEAELPRRLAAGRGRGPLSLAVLDLDGFKALNDSRGHAAGDECLRRCAERWAAALRPGDLLARLGGDEFGLVLSGCALDGAEAVVARIRDTTTGVGCSAGVVEWDHREDPDALHERADRALYAAKRHARSAPAMSVS